jgi:hypothetical protein
LTKQLKSVSDENKRLLSTYQKAEQARKDLLKLNGGYDFPEKLNSEDISDVVEFMRRVINTKNEDFEKLKGSTEQFKRKKFHEIQGLQEEIKRLKERLVYYDRIFGDIVEQELGDVGSK